jgi:hypothetical protein
MKFELVHHVFNTTKTFTEHDVPSWLLHRENKWFWESRVQKLEVGKSVETDMHTIRRIE